MTSLSAASVNDASRFCIGVDGEGKPIYWAPSDSHNPHVLVAGMSGSGKTHVIRHLIVNLLRLGITLTIFDIKGDLGYDNFVASGLEGQVSEADFNTLDFSYVGGSASVNLLRFPRNPEAGGIEMSVQHAIEAIRLFNPRLGHKQAIYLDGILKHVYLRADIEAEDQSTWDNPPPTLLDLMGLLEDIRKAIAEGNPVEDAAEQAFEFYDKKSIESLMDTIQGMINTKLFTRDDATRKRGKINRFVLSGISPPHQSVILHIGLGQTFFMSQAEAIRREFDPQVPYHMVITDEGKHAKQQAKSDLSPLNRIATEGRGIGCGIIAGVQTADQLTKDLMRSFGTRFITLAPEGDRRTLDTLLGIPPSMLKQLKPKENCLFQSGAGQYQLIRQFVSAPPC